MAALVAVPAAALGAAVLLVAGLFSGSGAGVADAAIIHRADAALTRPPNAIFHIAVAGGGFESQTWELTGPPYSRLAYKGTAGGISAEEATSGGTASWWDPASNTIHERLAPAPAPPFDDPPVQVRSELRAGRARVLGTAELDGTPAYRIQLGIKSASDGRSPVAYVDQTTYRPLLLAAPQRDGSITRLRVTAFEYLPRTRANLRLLSLRARRPGARVVR